MFPGNESLQIKQTSSMSGIIEEEGNSLKKKKMKTAYRDPYFHFSLGDNL